MEINDEKYNVTHPYGGTDGGNWLYCDCWQLAKLTGTTFRFPIVTNTPFDFVQFSYYAKGN
ncbi:hypothetical protein SLU01_17020 [Sporosarcina luteola]|uniref:Uncharacterized protein n=1 Tax=Sporosarcina luteola TaxID=582850 RepID=A0A511Z7I6_9BACL|nr:hypothetical protein SLU01_17020 [Sporosarcina luteola]